MTVAEMTLTTYFLLTLSIAAALMLCERLWAASSDASDRSVNLYAAVLYFVTQFWLLPFVALNDVAARFALVDLASWPFLWAAIAFTLLMDFGEFAFHRAQHRIPLLWRMHALHHSDPNMNVTTTVRHFWGDQLIKAVTIWPACVLLLRPTPGVILFYGLVSFYHFFSHSNLRVSLGGWAWLINHPAYHRRHHSSRPEHFNSNYAGIFPIFDVLFGSYRRPDGYPPTGLAKAPQSLVDVALWPLKSSGT